MTELMKEELMKEEKFCCTMPNIKTEKVDYIPTFVKSEPGLDSAVYRDVPVVATNETVPSLSATIDDNLLRHLCHLCDKTFKHKQGLTDHLSRSHGETTTTPDYSCNFCGKTFTTCYLLHRHITTHYSANPVPCNRAGCSQTFSTERDMKQHIATQHIQRKYLCTTCGKMFTRISNLNRHIKLHQNIREYPCSLCDKEFTQRVHRDKHMLIHYRSSNQCVTFDTSSIKPGYFSKHISNVCFSHKSPEAPTSSAKPMKCPICSATFKDLKRLRGHIIQIHHVDNVCPQCNVQHKDFQQFVDHLGECYREDKETSAMLVDFASSLLDNFPF